MAAGLLELSAGEPCVGPDETILDAGLAASLGKGVGDEVLFFALRRIRRLTITGLAESRALRWFGEGGGVVIDIEPYLVEKELRELNEEYRSNTGLVK